MKAAAQTAGVHFVDPGPTFSGHSICQDDAWINSVVAFKNRDASFHPNGRGQGKRSKSEGKSKTGYAKVLNEFLAAEVAKARTAGTLRPTGL